MQSNNNDIHPVSLILMHISPVHLMIHSNSIDLNLYFFRSIHSCYSSIHRIEMILYLTSFVLYNHENSSIQNLIQIQNEYLWNTAISNREGGIIKNSSKVHITYNTRYVYEFILYSFKYSMQKLI